MGGNNNATAIAILLIVFFTLIFMGVHIMYSMLASSFVTAVYLHVNLQTMVMQILKGLNVYSLMAVPFFILAGEIMMRGGITDRLVGLSKALVGWIQGSLSQVNIVASILFGSISGSSAADTASVGAMLIPLMEKDGYSADFATCVTMASSVEGMLIPPSHNMVIFAMAAGSVSIARLFMGGVVPGLLLALVLGIYCFIIAKKEHHPKGDPFNLSVAVKALLRALPGLGTILIVVIGVLAGIFTATEAAAFAVVYAIVIGIFFYKEIKITDLPDILIKALKTIGMIMMLIGCSSCFSWLVSYLNISAMLSNWLLSITTNKYIILFMMNIFLLICGMVMDMSAIILIVTPILLPIAQQFGMDPANFCAMLILNLGIGLITPPVGNTLFIGSAISKKSIGELARSMIPFYIMMFVALMLVTYVPWFSTFLPNLLGT